MQQIRVHKPGSYDRLRLVELPEPVPGPGQVRVDTTAIGVNYADCVVRMGLYASAKKYVGWPITPGFEFVGHIGAAGEGVDDLAVGTRVVGVTRFGGYASSVVVPREQVFAAPESMTDAELAGIPCVFLTAWYALVELAAARPDQPLLVHSAAGGVGGALLQLAAIAGCRAVGVVGAAHKVAPAMALGAAAIIDKSSQDLWASAKEQAPDGYAAIFDANGHATLQQSYDHLGPTGRLVVYGFHTMLPRRGGRPSWPQLILGWLRMPRFNPLQMTGDNKSVMAFNLSYLFDRNDVLQASMGAILGHIEAGRIVAPQTKTWPLARVADAHRELESGMTVGKLVLLP